MTDRRPRRPPVDYSAFNFDDDDDFVDSSSSSSSRGGSQDKQKNGTEKKKTKDRTKTSSEAEEKKKNAVANVNDQNDQKKSEKKEKKKAKNELNEIDLKEDATRTLESFLSSPSRRCERKSLDEKRFERELEMAMKLSKQVSYGL